MITASHIATVRTNHWVSGVFKYFQHKLSVLESFGYGQPLTSTKYKSLARTDQYDPTSAATFVERGEGFTAKGGLNLTLQELEAYRLAFRVDMELTTMQELDAELRQNPAWDGTTAFEAKAMNATYKELLGLQRQIFYGTGSAAKGFLGLKEICQYTSANVLALTDIAEDTDFEKSVINVGGSTSSTASSVYAVRFGDSACELRLGGPALNGEAAGIESFLSLPPPVDVERTSDSYTTTAWYRTAPLSGYAALVINGSTEARSARALPQFCVRRAANVTADSGKTCTDTVLGKLVDSFPEGDAPDVIYMSTRSGEQLRDSRDGSSSVTVFLPGESGGRNTVALRSDLPDNFNGIRIVRTASIRNNDAIES